jgi:hypothetical protein
MLVFGFLTKVEKKSTQMAFWKQKFANEERFV